MYIFHKTTNEHSSILVSVVHHTVQVVFTTRQLETNKLTAIVQTTKLNCHDIPINGDVARAVMAVHIWFI